NLTLGSTKMKTRWLPGQILMPQPGSFEPMKGTFQPGNDPRAADFQTCLAIFIKLVNETCALRRDGLQDQLNQVHALRDYNRVSYEFPIGYADPSATPVHNEANTT